MANYSVEDVKELRKRTGCFLTDCKKSLVEFDGDFEKALEWLRVNGREVTCRCGYPMSRAHEMHREREMEMHRHEKRKGEGS